MSAHSRQLEEALDLMFEASAISRLAAYAVENMPVAGEKRQEEMLSAVGRAADAVLRLTMDAIELVDDVSDVIRSAS